jgi:hypothetical protein
MSRSTKKKKPEPHCKVVGCSICEDARIKESQNRAFKHRKQAMKGSEE